MAWWLLDDRRLGPWVVAPAACRDQSLAAGATYASSGGQSRRALQPERRLLRVLADPKVQLQASERSDCWRICRRRGVPASVEHMQRLLGKRREVVESAPIRSVVCGGLLCLNLVVAWATATSEANWERIDGPHQHRFDQPG